MTCEVLYYQFQKFTRKFVIKVWDLIYLVLIILFVDWKYRRKRNFCLEVDIILKWNVWVEHESVVHPFYKSLISWPKSWLNQYYVTESLYLEMECKLHNSCFIFAVGEAEWETYFIINDPNDCDT